MWCVCNIGPYLFHTSILTIFTVPLFGAAFFVLFGLQPLLSAPADKKNAPPSWPVVTWPPTTIFSLAADDFDMPELQQRPLGTLKPHEVNFVLCLGLRLGYLRGGKVLLGIEFKL